MSSTDPFLLFAALAGVGLAVYWSSTGATRGLAEKFVGSIGGGFALAKPTLWFVVDDQGVNMRLWADFSARSSRNLNIGFLNITRSACLKTQGGDFAVRELLGRKAVSQAIYELHGRVPDGVEQAPPVIWRAWARAALLTYGGGLYLDGLSLCLGPSFMDVVRSKDDAVFGTDHDETRVTETAACGPYAGWASGAQHIGWIGLSDAMAELIAVGPTAWTAAIARNQVAESSMVQLTPFMSVVRESEWSRRSDGRAIEIEDLLGRSPDEEWVPPRTAVYVPLDKERLERNFTYNWFLRMSPEQILDAESHFLWASLARR